ncbi:MAG: hypothetical protein MUQ27_04690, partial [Acidimicrobiia bacterium]|nr:hypothetical protein [Acidimicrobiia bacterium]
PHWATMPEWSAPPRWPGLSSSRVENAASPPADRTLRSWSGGACFARSAAVSAQCQSLSSAWSSMRVMDMAASLHSSGARG